MKLKIFIPFNNIHDKLKYKIINSIFLITFFWNDKL